MKIYKKMMLVSAAAMFSIFICGCGEKKAADQEASQVIQISIAPESVTPTPALDQIDPAAVATNGNLTMINEYLTDAPSTPSVVEANAADIPETGNTGSSMDQAAPVNTADSINTTDTNSTDTDPTSTAPAGSSGIGGGNTIISMDSNAGF